MHCFVRLPAHQAASTIDVLWMASLVAPHPIMLPCKLNALLSKSVAVTHVSSFVLLWASGFRLAPKPSSHNGGLGSSDR